MSFWLIVWANGNSTQLWHKLACFLPFLIHVRMRLFETGGERFSKKEIAFIFVVSTLLFVQAYCPITGKNQYCWFLVRYFGILKTRLAVFFALQTIKTTLTIFLTCMDLDTLLLWTNPSRTNDFSKNSLNCFFVSSTIQMDW